MCTVLFWCRVRVTFPWNTKPKLVKYFKIAAVAFSLRLDYRCYPGLGEREEGLQLLAWRVNSKWDLAKYWKNRLEFLLDSYVISLLLVWGVKVTGDQLTSCVHLQDIKGLHQQLLRKSQVGLQLIFMTPTLNSLKKDLIR